MKVSGNLWTVSLGLLLLLLACGGGDTAVQKIGFMENGNVFEAFEMKIDYDKMMEKEMRNESSKLDSLGVILNQGGLTDSLEVYKLRKEYYITEEIFNKKFEQLSTQFTAEVNERLNGYVDEFASEKGYSLILGSGGSGNIMYVKDEDNITDELIVYINKKYSK